MKIESDAFQNGSVIPLKYTCDGEKISPALSFHGIPENAKSLALILEDPDAPKGTFDHWIVWNISPDTKEINEGEAAPGIIGKNTAGTKDYIPPCPPNGQHRYFFKLFALDATISLASESSKTELLQTMEGHILKQAELVAVYYRSQ